jgi:hypothetical protein
MLVIKQKYFEPLLYHCISKIKAVRLFRITAFLLGELCLTQTLDKRIISPYFQK